MLFTVLLTILLVVKVGAYYNTEIDCPLNGEAVFSNPNDSSSYFHCYNGYSSIWYCPEGSRFSTISKKCVKSRVNRNEEKMMIYDDIPETCIKNSITPVICPQDIEDHRLMAHPDDCRLFYYCVEGDKPPICRECPANLHFNPTKNICDYPEFAGCLADGLLKSNIQTLKKKQYVDSQTKFDTEAGNCNGEFQILPDPVNPERYLVCTFMGTLQSIACMPGEIFNPVKKICETKSTEDFPNSKNSVDSNFVRYNNDMQNIFGSDFVNFLNSFEVNKKQDSDSNTINTILFNVNINLYKDIKNEDIYPETMDSGSGSGADINFKQNKDNNLDSFLKKLKDNSSHDIFKLYIPSDSDDYDYDDLVNNDNILSNDNDLKIDDQDLNNFNLINDLIWSKDDDTDLSSTVDNIFNNIDNDNYLKINDPVLNYFNSQDDLIWINDDDTDLNNSVDDNIDNDNLKIDDPVLNHFNLQDDLIWSNDDDDTDLNNSVEDELNDIMKKFDEDVLYEKEDIPSDNSKIIESKYEKLLLFQTLLMP